jgi:FdhD protein
MQSTFKSVLCRKLSGGRFSMAEASVIIERELPVYTNGQHLFTACIAPGMEKEFVAGYLFGQGFINSVSEVESISIENDSAKVILIKRKDKQPGMMKPSFRIVSGGGKTAYFEASSFPTIQSSLKLNTKDIFQAMNILFEKASLYRETEGVHAAGLFTVQGLPLCIAEDIGRHNTLDKIIGHALLNKVECSNVFLVSTGRMASEMVMKICRAGIPLVATKTAITDKGLETGQKCGLTIIGFVRAAGTKLNTDMDVRTFDKSVMRIYSGAERVV